MIKNASEAAKLYARELPVLEQARSELHDVLDEIWHELWTDVKPQLTEMQCHSGREVCLGKRSDPGAFRILTNQKLPVKLKLQYRDLRQESIPNSFSIGISASIESRKLMEKDSSMVGMLSELCAKRGLDKPDIKKSVMIKEAIEVSLDDVESAAETIKDRIIQFFGVITDFEQRIITKGQ